MFPVLIPPRPLFITVLTIFGVWFSPQYSFAAPQLTLTWRDNSTNENGFIIERKPATGGTYVPVAQVGQNDTSYIDVNVEAGSRYCYRVQSFNNDGASTYSNEACGSVGTTEPPMSMSISVVGQGSVTSNPAGISCAPTCEKGFPRGMTVSLTATPASGWQFQGWGGNCVGKAPTCALTIDQVKNVTASFFQSSGGGGSTTNPTIGMFRDGAWWIDNGNEKKEVCSVDTCVTFGQSGDQPVLGYWVKGGKKLVGIFRRGAWYLDSNGNGRLDGCTGGDTCFSFGLADQSAVAGDINGDGQSEIGVFSNGRWYFDNGNGRWDGCSIDTCISGFGLTGDQPLIGDWNGDGRSDIGVFRNGGWYLDSNGNRHWDGCGVDTCFSFGGLGDLAVVGDWNGDQRSQIGVFRRGEWYLDSGNGAWNGCAVDKCIRGLGANGDIPISR
jgi:hypothetical protein